MQTTLVNIIGFILKVGLIPSALFFLVPADPDITRDFVSNMLSSAGIILGLMGVIYAELMLLRFGDGRSHFARHPDRLVDVGMYARTRHPYHWFLSLYHFGIFIHFYQVSSPAILLGAIYFFGGLVFLIIYQEKQLTTLGTSYESYRKSTPAWFWSLNIPENHKVMVLPQLIWVFGRIVLKMWYRIRVTGKEHIPHNKSFLMVANHESYIDPFLFGIFVPFDIQFVTTADVFTNRFMNFLLKGVGTFPMRRHRQDLRSIRTMIRMINEGRTVCIFPEGGRSFDGSPLRIVDETVKLIQRCKVPILPVQISGAYEIWPRWAPNRRRSQFSAHFQPVIPVEDQSDLNELRKRIQKAIFPENREFTATRSSFMVKGLDRFIWACVSCHTHHSIHIASTNSIACSHCGINWEMDDKYLLHSSEGETTTLINWVEHIDSTIRTNPLKTPLTQELSPGETAYLAAPIKAYHTDEGEFLQNDLELILSDQRFILSRSGKVLHEWEISLVTVLTLDFDRAVSIGYGGVRHRFLLQDSDIPFKWRSYYQVLTGKAAN